LTPADLVAELKRRALAQGFDAVGIAPADAAPEAAERLRRFVALGRHGDMEWMAETEARRGHPKALWPEMQSIVMLAMSYTPDSDPLQRLSTKTCGAISVYALGRDYHEVIKGKLKQLAGWLAKASGADVKVFVDTAPLMEKPLAQAAGLGWQGKHSNVLSRDLGSWFFLGAIATTASLPCDGAETEHCGSCRACLDICPTRAFPQPFQLDARRCISYLTIEHKGHIAREFRRPMGNRIFGCDDCLAVCPWNKFARAGREAKLKARAELVAPPLADLARLDDQEFRKLFAGSPVKRTGRDRFIRNVLIAIGNSGDPGLAGEAERLLQDRSPLVRAMAIWALSQLAPDRAVELSEGLAPLETDGDVRREWAGVRRT
jgi:epoxyqueuosine reductase